MIGEILKLRTFNFVTSLGAFVLGTIYVFSDGASITANVIGASGESSGMTAVVGLFMIIGAIGLFIVSRDSTDHRSIDLERLVRATKNNRDLNTELASKSKEEEYKERP
jgi:membrane associated rhomboid family serine protease